MAQRLVARCPDCSSTKTTFNASVLEAAAKLERIDSGSLWSCGRCGSTFGEPDRGSVEKVVLWCDGCGCPTTHHYERDSYERGTWARIYACGCCGNDRIFGHS